MYEHNHLIVLYDLTQARIAFTYPSVKLGDTHHLLHSTHFTRGRATELEGDRPHLPLGARDKFIRLLLLLLDYYYYFF